MTITQFNQAQFTISRKNNHFYFLNQVLTIVTGNVEAWEINLFVNQIYIWEILLDLESWKTLLLYILCKKSFWRGNANFG